MINSPLPWVSLPTAGRSHSPSNLRESGRDSLQGHRTGQEVKVSRSPTRGIGFKTGGNIAETPFWVRDSTWLDLPMLPFKISAKTFGLEWKCWSSECFTQTAGVCLVPPFITINLTAAGLFIEGWSWTWGRAGAKAGFTLYTSSSSHRCEPEQSCFLTFCV